MRQRDDIRDYVTGKWRGILASLGVPDSALKDQHGPCPMCGGRDRFRFDNKEGRGTYFCNQCGSGDGWNLLMNFRGWNFAEAADEVRAVCGRVNPEPIRQEASDEQKRERLRELWKASVPVQRGDVVDRYFQSRGIDELSYPESLRFCPSCWYAGDKHYPALIGVVSDADGKPVTLHRTWLAPDGSGKAPEDEVRRIMPGKIPDGAAIRLGEAGYALGIAEGIETALSAMQMYELPVWAVINSTMMEKWEPPASVEELTIFADNDAKFGGQKAAYALAHRLSVKGLSVAVKVPGDVGTDFNDMLKLKERLVA
ncbi:DUF7146 domain-containing protein [Roseovarius indicus]|uniref:DNA primase (Bacterial type) n=1 Tax=Roseovarius indicus TaxID=540747 RepID=A0A0T5P8Q7_9RHOB|nr:toprim domain-containing protein [Roseovarius indicus]KRS17520.1 hypothetical protein XM52_13650 [Roseovarius indicus]QEW26723.1 DNA primase (bacterial type) [Roseovarius indicus]SFD61072.1 putative DNA primase/helicase [Roseovarius indicus]